MKEEEQADKFQYSFVVRRDEEDKGLDIKDELLAVLIKLQQNPKITADLQAEAKEAHYTLFRSLKFILIKSFEDEAETKPKEIAFELDMAHSHENDEQIRWQQLNFLAFHRDLIERDEATEYEIERYDQALKIVALPFIDTSHQAHFLIDLVEEIFTKKSVLIAIQIVLLDRKGATITDTDSVISRLYPNSKTIDLTKSFGINMFLSDNYVRGIRGANQAAAQQQFNHNNPDLHPKVKSNAAFKIKNKDKGQTETEFVFDQAKFAIRTAEEFANRLMDLRNAKVLQIFCALMKLANIQDSPIYRKVPLSELMQIVLKPSGKNKFNKEQRADFSEALHKLSDVSISVYAIGQEVNVKTGKKGRAVMKEERGIKVFRMVAEYSVKKEFQGLPKETLLPENFDKTVIERVSGEILPGNAHMFQQPARVYPDSLLHMNANTDAKAILLGFVIQTRFSQSPETPLEWDRPYLIDLCDYHKTNNTKPSQATKQLVNNLDKLKKLGIISRYSGLTDGNQGKIKIYPPVNAKPALAS